MTIIYIILIIILLLGVIHILYDVRETTRKQESINTFLGVLDKFITKYKENKNNSKEVGIIMADGEEISKYMGEDAFSSPILTIQEQIRNKITFTIEEEVHKVFCNAPQALNQLEKIKKSTRLQLLNPFIWFYRGVEVLSYIILGYFINTGSIEYRGKAWNAFNTIFTLITGFATLIGLYLQITQS